MNEIQTLSSYQVQELAGLFYLHYVENIGIDINNGNLIVGYIQNGEMKTKQIKRINQQT